MLQMYFSFIRSRSEYASLMFVMIFLTDKVNNSRRMHALRLVTILSVLCKVLETVKLEIFSLLVNLSPIYSSCYANTLLKIVDDILRNAYNNKLTVFTLIDFDF